MSDLESRLAAFRREHSGALDRLIYRDRAELVDLEPRSPGAAQVIHDLDSFAHRSSVARRLTDHLESCLPARAARPSSVLEICAGTGWLGFDLADRRAAAGCPIELLATDAQGPRRSPSTVTADRAARSRWCVADATRLPFRDASFDLVICSMALHHFPPEALALVLTEASRVGRRICLFDLRRTVYGVAMVGLIAAAYSRVFVRDAITSHRRAYHVREMRFLINELGLPLLVREFLSFGMLVESAPES